MLKVVFGWMKEFLKGLDWVIQTMDVTQWAIISVIFVVLGFMALRTRA